MDFVKFVKQSIEREPLSAILIIIGFVFLGMFIGGVLQIVTLLVFELQNAGGLEAIGDGLLKGEMDMFSNWWALNISVGVASFFTFIFSGIIYWKYVERKQWDDLNSSPGIPSLSQFLLVALIYLSSAPFIAYLGEINENIQMPGFLKGVEEWMRTMEDSAIAITDFLSSTTSIGQLLANIIVVGVFAGIGEELVFRGLFQRKLIKLFHNYHVAVWVAAIIFSAIHFQFYGFFPRLVLGVLFGYLYIWSGNILIPIFAHTLNNSVAVLLGHLLTTGVLSSEYEDIDVIPIPALLITTVLCIFLLQFYIKTQNKKRVDVS